MYSTGGLPQPGHQSNLAGSRKPLAKGALWLSRRRSGCLMAAPMVFSF